MNPPNNIYVFTVPVLNVPPSQAVFITLVARLEPVPFFLYNKKREAQKDFAFLEWLPREGSNLGQGD